MLNYCSGRRKFQSGRDGYTREPYTIDGKADDFDVFVQSIDDATTTDDVSSKLHPLVHEPLSCLSNHGGRRTPFLVPCSTAADSTEKVYTVDGRHGRYINAIPVHCHVDVNSQRVLVKPPTIQTVFEMEAFHAKIPSQMTYLEEEDEDEEEPMETSVNSMAEEVAEGSHIDVRISRT